MLWPRVLLLGLLVAPNGYLRAATPGDFHKVNRLLYKGKYRCTVSGVLCNACTRAIVEQLQLIRGVKQARFDFAEGFLWLTIGPERKVRLSEVERALRLAAERVNLSTRFELTDVQYGP